MRLLALEVERFGPIRRAAVELGPGLNVLYGPNDLGKSSLTEAVRAALLLVPSSTHHETYVPWGTEENPSVALTFQVEPTERWRVRKTFGTGSKAQALLERALGQGPFSREATGKEVEGRLRALLRWGVQAPTSKRGASGLADTYLSRLLIGRQSEVAEIFERSLEQDQDESGKQRLTVALKALAQDPLLKKLLDRAQARTDLVYSAGGVPRRAQDSPLVQAREEVREAEERLASISKQGGGREALEAQLQQLSERRDESSRRLDAALAQRTRVQEAAARGRAIEVEARRVEDARKVRDGIRATHQAVASKTLETEGLRARLAVVESDHAVAHAALAAAEHGVRAGEARLEAVTSERAGSRELRRKTLEAKRLELEAARDQASRRADAARRASTLAGDAGNRQVAFDEAQAERSRLEAVVGRSAAEVEHEEARAEEEKGRALIEAVTDAERLHGVRKGELERAAKRLVDANLAVERADAVFEQARERRERAQSEAGAQQRALKEEELTRRKLEAEASLGAADARAQRAREVQAHLARVRQGEEQLAASRSLETQASASVATGEQALSKAQGALDRLALVGGFMEWRAAAMVCAEAEAAMSETSRWIAQLAELRSRAEALEVDLKRTVVPNPGLLPQFRSLDRDLATAEARLDVGLSVVVNPRQAFHLLAAADDGEVDETTATVGEEFVCEAKRKLKLTIGDVADLTVTGGRQEDHTRAQELRTRWNAEVLPVLNAAGVKDLPALEALLRTTAERLGELATLRQQVANLESHVQRAGDAAGRLEAAQRAVADRLAALGGQDPIALEKEATGLGLLPPAGPLFSPQRAPASPGSVLEGQRSKARAALDETRNRLEAARVGQAQAKLRIETATKELDNARAEYAAAVKALPGAADEALRSALEEAEVARRALSAIEAERSALAKDQDSALTDARSQCEQAEAARSAARRAKDQEQRAHDEAQRGASAVEGQLVVRRQAAAGVDLSALTQRRTQLASALTRTPTVPIPSALPGDSALARLRAWHESLRVSLTQAQSKLASAETARDAALAKARESQQELAGNWKEVLAAAETALAAAGAELATVQQELAALDLNRDTAITAAAADLASAKEALEQARVAERNHAAARDAARTQVDTAQGQLSMMRDAAATQDERQAEAELARCQAAVAALPPPEPGVLHDEPAVRAADAAVREAERGLEEARIDLGRVQAQLEVTGGTILQDRVQDAKEAVDRLTRKQQEIELDFAAWKLLRDALVEAEASQQTHLGERLSGPVTARFRELTGGRYGHLALGPNLDTLGILAAGERRPLEQLSIGTRDQLSAILRLTVAAELQSALVLDDQLAQTDPRRLGWFTQALRGASKTVQVIVITCRADDYVGAEEMPAPPATSKDSLEGLLRAVNLEKVIERSGA